MSHAPGTLELPKQREIAVEVRLLVLAGRTSSREILLHRFPILVGRQRDCQLRITSRLVSRRHCQLTEEGGWLFVEDRGSSNGTFVNGDRLAGRTMLKPGDSLDVGPISFEVDYVPGPAEGAESRSDAARARQIPTIIGENGVGALPGMDLAETHFVEMVEEGEVARSPLSNLSDDDAETRLPDEHPDDAGPILDADGSPDLSWMERT